MNAIKISGGLGNQMFQYAFVAKKNPNKLFFLEKKGDPIELYNYFKLKKNIFYFIDIIFFNHTGYKLIFSHYLRNIFYSFVKKKFISKTVVSSNTDTPSSQLSDCDGVLFEGYFQSPLYLQDCGDNFDFFELKRGIKKSYCKLYRFPGKEGYKKVVIHIRRTDYKNLGHLNLGGDNLSLPFSYYHTLLKKIHNDNNFYIFISDEPEIIAKEFQYITDKHVSTDSAIVDFQHMLNADICIIANSTLSWWGAYLNKNHKKTVYCPKYFLGFLIKQEYPHSIYPENWIQTEVYNDKNNI